MITSKVAPSPAPRVVTLVLSKRINPFVYPVPPFVTVISSTMPPCIDTAAKPPVPSPKIGTPVTVPVEVAGSPVVGSAAIE